MVDKKSKDNIKPTRAKLPLPLNNHLKKRNNAVWNCIEKIVWLIAGTIFSVTYFAILAYLCYQSFGIELLTAEKIKFIFIGFPLIGVAILYIFALIDFNR